MENHPDGKSSGWKIIRVENHPGGKSSGWKIIRVENHPGGKSRTWTPPGLGPSGWRTPRPGVPTVDEKQWMGRNPKL
jgi:hypothetical protein